jgi:uncharacterized membrane protein YfcA
MMTVVAILIGLATGVISGLIGLGGGVFIVPALVYVFKMSQHEAQGTSLATLLLPIGLFGFLEYYRQGNVDLRVAALLAVGFAVGVFAGGRWAQAIPDVVLRRVFAVTLVLVASRMWFGR